MNKTKMKQIIENPINYKHDSHTDDASLGNMCIIHMYM